MCSPASPRLFVAHGSPAHPRGQRPPGFTNRAAPAWLGRVGHPSAPSPDPAAPERERPHPRGLQRQAAGRATQAARSSTPSGKPRPLVEGWRQTYNQLRPHSSLGYRPPAPETTIPAPSWPVTPAPTHNPKENSHHPTNTNPGTNTAGRPRRQLGDRRSRIPVEARRRGSVTSITVHIQPALLLGSTHSKPNQFQRSARRSAAE